MGEDAPKRGIGHRNPDGKAPSSLVERAVEESDSAQSRSRGIGRRRADSAGRQHAPEKPEALIEKATQHAGLTLRKPNTNLAAADDTQNIETATSPSTSAAGYMTPTKTNGDILASQTGTLTATGDPDSNQWLAQGVSGPTTETATHSDVDKAPIKQSLRRDADAVIDLESLKAAGYITPDMPTNLLSEEFRIIKRSLVLRAFATGENKTKQGNMILVSSSNPGEGKTFCAVNLALSIATEQDVTVLLVDADFSKPDALNRLGVNAGRGLMDILDDSSLHVGDCLVRTNIPNLVLLPAGRPHNLGTELLASERMRDVATEMATRYRDRIIIFDSPPALASSAASVLALHTGQAVFIIEAEKTTESQIKESLNLLSACPNINLLLNKTRFSGSSTKFATYYGYGAK